MRLPSQPYDNKDLLRNMSIAGDTPDNLRIMEAEDYLQPRSTAVEVPPPASLAQQIPVAGDRSPNMKLERVCMGTGARVRGNIVRNDPVMYSTCILGVYPLEYTEYNHDNTVH